MAAPAASAAAAAVGSTSPGMLSELIKGTIWHFSTDFKFLGYFPQKNNGMIVKCNGTGSGEPCLVAVNAPSLNTEMKEQIKLVERETDLKLKWIIGTDWHHTNISQWTSTWPEATVLFPGSRAVRIHEHETFNRIVLDRDAPAVPHMDPQSMTLIPWRGFHGPPNFLGDGRRDPEETLRGEYSVWMPNIGLLYIFDILLPHSPSKGFFGKLFGDGEPYGCNFGSGLVGFRTADHALAKTSIDALLALPVQTLVFGHGNPKYGAIVTGEAQCKEVLRHNLTRVKI